MASERERIKKMLAEGKVSPEEAARLEAAIDAAEVGEGDTPARRPGGTGDGGAGKMGDDEPRLSRLALASALCLPGAVVVGILVALLAQVATGGQRISEGAVALGAISGVAVLLTGFIAGIAALRSIRARPRRLRGRGLCIVGIVGLPAALVLVFLLLMAGGGPPDTGHPVSAKKVEAHD
ncbi:MAG: SHOCT-like domain-containing protein [Planctomycetota bacterium]|jgi:hypothetical protein